MTLAVPLKPLMPATEANPIAVGDGSPAFYAMAPVSPPISAGEPPVVPDLVIECGVSFPGMKAGSRAGYVVTRSTDIERNASVRVRWTALTKDERDSLLAFWRNDCRMGERSMSIRIDGPGTDAVSVLPVGVPTDVYVGKGGSAKVYSVEFQGVVV